MSLNFGFSKKTLTFQYCILKASEFFTTNNLMRADYGNKYPKPTEKKITPLSRHSVKIHVG